jgi:serine/threonine protein kinase
MSGRSSPGAPAQMEGWIRRRQFLGFYNLRYLTLNGNILTVRRDETTIKGEVQIEITAETQIDFFDTDKAPRFRIANPASEPHFLQADSEESCAQWVLALRSCTFTQAQMSMDDFMIISVIGRGFYGKVMLCEHKETKERVAIKTVHKSRLVEANKVHTIMMERKILSRVNHPFIVSLKFAFQTPAKLYLGLEYAEGGELFFFLQKHGLPTVADLRLYMAELMLALNYLHSQGIIYRDVKPENILLDARGHIKLTDFGLSKELRRGAQTETFCGTCDYIAPEIVRRESYSYGVDWWACGILLYELACGETPFMHENRARLFRNIVENAVAFP